MRKIGDKTRKYWSVSELIKFIEERFRVIKSVESSRKINDKSIPAVLSKEIGQSKAN